LVKIGGKNWGQPLIFFSFTVLVSDYLVKIENSHQFFYLKKIGGCPQFLWTSS
jgi:hypothetical protein